MGHSRRCSQLLRKTPRLQLVECLADHRCHEPRTRYQKVRVLHVLEVLWKRVLRARLPVCLVTALGAELGHVDLRVFVADVDVGLVVQAGEVRAVLGELVRQRYVEEVVSELGRYGGIRPPAEGGGVRQRADCVELLLEDRLEVARVVLRERRHGEPMLREPLQLHPRDAEAVLGQEEDGVQDASPAFLGLRTPLPLLTPIDN